MRGCAVVRACEVGHIDTQVCRDMRGESTAVCMIRGGGL